MSLEPSPQKKIGKSIVIWHSFWIAAGIAICVFAILRQNDATYNTTLRTTLNTVQIALALGLLISCKVRNFTGKYILITIVWTGLLWFALDGEKKARQEGFGKPDLYLVIFPPLVLTTIITFLSQKRIKNLEIE